MTVFICKEEPEDIWCAVYDAWRSRLGHDHVRIEPEGEDRELFCEYRYVQTDAEKAVKVVKSIREKLSDTIFETVYKAALSQDRFRANKIYRFLIYAFSVGPTAAAKLQIPEIYEIFQMNRHLEREYQHMLGFTRFSQMEKGVLFAVIGPKNDLLILLAEHFADRMSCENWIIYDDHRKKAAVFQSGKGWGIVRSDSANWKEHMRRHSDENTMESLWKTFCQTIAIEERCNPRCQTNMLPLRFRSYMTEFQKDSSEE